MTKRPRKSGLNEAQFKPRSRTSRRTFRAAFRCPRPLTLHKSPVEGSSEIFYASLILSTSLLITSRRLDDFQHRMRGRRSLLGPNTISGRGLRKCSDHWRAAGYGLVLGRRSCWRQAFCENQFNRAARLFLQKWNARRHLATFHRPRRIEDTNRHFFRYPKG